VSISNFIKKSAKFSFKSAKDYYQSRLNAQRTKEAYQVLRKFSCPYRLHLGCGENRFEGWINIDLNSGDLMWDLTQKTPFADASCNFIYSEHVIEHFPVDMGIKIFTECYRILQSGGVMRVAMPSLESIVENYTSGKWQDQDWIKSGKYGDYSFIKTGAEMLNYSLRNWGHQWVYDSEELQRRLNEAGFKKTKMLDWGISNHGELSNRETRQDSKLIYEAEK